MLPLATELDVTLAIEPMHPGCATEWTFLTSLDEAVGLVDVVGSPRVKLAFDTYHLGHDPRILDEIGCLRDRIAIVHLGDSLKPPDAEQSRQRRAPGSCRCGKSSRRSAVSGTTATTMSS